MGSIREAEGAAGKAGIGAEASEMGLDPDP